MKMLGNIYETAVGRALNTVREKTGEYETDRSTGRVLTGSIPGVDVGRTGERLAHDVFDQPPLEERTRRAEEYVRMRFATSGLVNPEAEDKPSDSTSESKMARGMKDALRDFEEGMEDSPRSRKD